MVVTSGVCLCVCVCVRVTSPPQTHIISDELQHTQQYRRPEDHYQSMPSPSISLPLIFFIISRLSCFGVRPHNIKTLLIWILPTSAWFVPMITHQLSSHHYRHPHPLLGLGFLGSLLQLHKGDLNKEKFKGIIYIFNETMADCLMNSIFIQSYLPVTDWSAFWSSVIPLYQLSGMLFFPL